MTEFDRMRTHLEDSVAMMPVEKRALFLLAYAQRLSPLFEEFERRAPPRRERFSQVLERLWRVAAGEPPNPLEEEVLDAMIPGEEWVVDGFYDTLAQDVGGLAVGALEGMHSPEGIVLHPEATVFDLIRLLLSEMRLGRLSRRACERLAREALGEALPADTVAALAERSDGNAFFLEELVRAAAEGREEAPGSVLSVMEARLDALAPEARRILRAGSVLGEHFCRGAVEALVGGAEGALSLDERLAEEVPDIAYDPDSDDDADYPSSDEVGGPRAGRLVGPDEGVMSDDDEQMLGTDVGIDGAGASAEEAAVHVITPEDLL